MDFYVFSIIFFHRIKPKSMPRRSDGLELTIHKHDEVIISPTCVGVKVHQVGDWRHKILYDIHVALFDIKRLFLFLLHLTTLYTTLQSLIVLDKPLDCS